MNEHIQNGPQDTQETINNIPPLISFGHPCAMVYTPATVRVTSPIAARHAPIQYHSSALHFAARLAHRYLLHAPVSPRYTALPANPVSQSIHTAYLLVSVLPRNGWI
jgi:hypothetical protein